MNKNIRKTVYEILEYKEMTRIREIEEQEYRLEYSNYNHIPRID